MKLRAGSVKPCVHSNHQDILFLFDRPVVADIYKVARMYDHNCHNNPNSQATLVWRRHLD